MGSANCSTGGEAVGCRAWVTVQRCWSTKNIGINGSDMGSVFSSCFKRLRASGSETHTDRATSCILFAAIRRTLAAYGKAVSAPATISFRSVGTSLHLHDGLQPYSSVTVNQTSNKKGPGKRWGEERGADVEYGPPIDEKHLPDYWRFAAGGEHKRRELEKRAEEAEAALETPDVAD